MSENSAKSIEKKYWKCQRTRANCRNCKFKMQKNLSKLEENANLNESANKIKNFFTNLPTSRRLRNKKFELSFLQIALQPI